MTQRQTIMRLLALTPAKILQAALKERLPSSKARGYALLRAPEAGLLMARGRISGSGSPFNIGEVLVTRCAVSLANETIGYAWILGEEHEKARAAALLDALWQDSQCGPYLDRTLLPVMELTLHEQRVAKAETTASTRVNFFTLVRGEN